MVREGIFLGQLEAYVEVARLGNVTHAAESLFLTQPALTGRLDRLEQEVGVRLLIRDRRGARLTEAGRAFLPHAEQVLVTMATALQAAVVSSAGSSVTLKLAATPTLSTYVLPAVIKSFIVQYPQVRLSVRTAASEEISELVLAGEVDLGLGRALHHPGIECIPLFVEEYVLVSEPNHRFATMGPLHLADFEDELIVLFSRSASYRELTQIMLHQAGVTPRGVIDLDNSEASKKMVELGIGVALLPRTSVTGEILNGALREIEVQDLAPMRRPMAALRLQVAPDNWAATRFLQVLAPHCMRLSAPELAH